MFTAHMQNELIVACSIFDRVFGDLEVQLSFTPFSAKAMFQGKLIHSVQ